MASEAGAPFRDRYELFFNRKSQGDPNCRSVGRMKHALEDAGHSLGIWSAHQPLRAIGHNRPYKNRSRIC